jgi:hypothetical protein
VTIPIAFHWSVNVEMITLRGVERREPDESRVASMPGLES